MRTCTFIALLLALLLPPAVAQPQGDDLGLQWRVADVERRGGGLVSRVRLTLTNRGRQSLPASGWGLYFTSLATAEVTQTPQLNIEQLAGTLYRLRPGPAFRGLAPGESTDFEFVQPELVIRPAKAPQGPYLAYDAAPAEARAITAYRIVPGLPPGTRLPDGRWPDVSAEELFDRHASLAPRAEPGLVLPTPVHEARQAGVLRLAAMPRIVAPPGLTPEVARVRQLFTARLPEGRQSGVPLRMATGRIAGLESPEAYRLRIDPHHGIELTGASAAGVARGIETLRQLLPAQPSSTLELPAVEIRDAPRFAYRGLLLDVARNFRSPGEVCRVIELMAQFKLNWLHLHLTDDEGWRLAIEGLPELTRYGAVRGHAADEGEHLFPAHGSGPDPHSPRGSGFYSAQDFVEILRCAAARRIDVMPEIEMPGHARAAVKAMDARAARLHAQGRSAEAEMFRLRDPRDTSRYRSAQLHDDNVIDPGLRSTQRFVAHVVREVASLYARAGVPLKRLHLGGDELGEGAWTQSPATLALMQREHLATTADVWNHFFEQVAQEVRATGARMAGWEELGARQEQHLGRHRAVPNPFFLGRGFELFVWNNLGDSEDLAYRLANAGYEVVLAPATRLYFDMAHDRDPQEPGVDWAAYADIDAAWSYAPLDATRASAEDPRPRAGLVPLTAAGRARVRGLEGTLFAEAMHEPAQTDELLMPRLLALAERAWAPDPDWARTRDPGAARLRLAHDWTRFRRLLGERVLPWLDLTWPDLNYRIAPPGLQRVGGEVRVSHLFPGTTVRYTLDGSAPSLSSPILLNALTTDHPVTAAAFSRNGRSSRSVTSPATP